MVIYSDRRRMIFDQVRAKAMSRGMPIDNDPKFLAWVELWISGTRCPTSGLDTMTSRHVEPGDQCLSLEPMMNCLKIPTRMPIET